MRRIGRWLVIIIVVFIVGSIIVADPVGAGHTVGGWISGFFHFLGQLSKFVQAL
jgi:hypothetical protein